MPARALKRVVLPVFGLPRIATLGVRRRTMVGSGVCLLHLDTGRLAATQAEPIAADLNLNGIAEGSKGKDANLLAFEESHLQKPLDDTVFPLNVLDAGPLADAEGVERAHRGSPGGRGECGRH
jgi:hypothetical protein